jgi:hypothetical protein
MVCAWARRRLGRPVNRKRVMRERRLIQRRRRSTAAGDPDFFRVERPDQLWHLDMTSVWVAKHGWVYLGCLPSRRRSRLDLRSHVVRSRQAADRHSGPSHLEGSERPPFRAIRVFATDHHRTCAGSVPRHRSDAKPVTP